MPIRRIRFHLFLSLIGLGLGPVAISAQDALPAPPDDRYRDFQTGPGAVRFADGSSAPANGGQNIQAGAPPLSQVPTLAPRPLGESGSPKPLELPPDMAPALPPAERHDTRGGAPLTPVPDAKYLGPAEIEVTSFHGITPGISTRADVEKAWGKAKESRQLESGLMQLYSVDPFPRVEISYTAGGKVSSMVIRFDHGFPAGQVAEQLELSRVQPVLVSNELGEVLGQAYPERGVLFSFEPASDPSKTLKKVTHIVLEPITAEPFVLRAETNIETRPEFSLHDADQAIKMQPSNARARWLKSRALSALGQHDLAVAAAAEAVRLEPLDARYQLAKAQTLQQSGHIAEAIPEAEKAIAMSETRPHVRARAICLLGDLKGAGAHPDYKAALQLHSQALKAADALVAEKHPAIRVAAKDVLLDAHLGALHDVCWGAWREKERSAGNWIAKATEIALDIIKTEDGGDEYLFRVSVRALAADVGLQGKLDPTKWAKEVVRSGEVMISAAAEPGRKAELQWQVSTALYDAMQVYQMRGNPDEALKEGELAIKYLETSGRHNTSPSAAYLLGRTYFRMGAVYANNRKDHRTAVVWFDKAVPLLGRTPPREAMVDLGRLGDSFVSMGVSYWSAGYRKKAVALTEHGADLIEEAVRRGMHARSSLITPYSNLAAMNREMGNTADASRAQDLAEKAKGTLLR
jgi:tetratricopeptide (TPR) repeat protein